MVSSRLFHSLAAAFVLLSASCSRQLPEAQIPIMAWYCIPAADATPERYRELAEGWLSVLGDESGLAGGGVDAATLAQHGLYIHLDGFCSRGIIYCL